MAKYFPLLPKIYYNLDDKKNLETVTNIMSSPFIGENLLENTSVYYTYEIRDSDTPEILASKLYNSPDRHWIILMMNNIVDPQYDWPLQYDELNRFIDAKYFGPEYANTSIAGEGLTWAKNSNINRKQHSYYKVVTKTVDGVENITKLQVDANTYANDVIMQTGTNENITLENGSILNYKITKEYKTYYDYEYELNESKREIKILKDEFIFTLENEIKNLYQQ